MSVAAGSIADVPGVEVGHWTDAVARTGVTTVVFPALNVAAGEIRGGFPAAREFSTLASGMNTGAVDAVVFAGGSSRGLAAAEGVVEGLAADGRGALSAGGPVLPTVAGAVVWDLGVGSTTAFPDLAAGRAAYDARSAEPVSGPVGAGVGCTVAKWRGPAATVPGGVGSSSVAVGDATVGALAVVNAVGDVFSLDGASLSGGPSTPPLFPAQEFGARQNTTLVAVATDARMSRDALLRLLVRVHDAFGVCLRPAHTRWDGDAALAVSCGEIRVHPDAIGEAAFVATAGAIAAAIS
ncbi:MAG: P1 family peptidase [Actinomycetota bacterium]